MRLWHQSLLPYLDNQRLLGQHRECCALRGKGWGRKHKTVDYVFKYDPAWLVSYHFQVMVQMLARGHKVNYDWYDARYRGNSLGIDENFVDNDKLMKCQYLRLFDINVFFREHNQEYLIECIELLKAKGANCDFAAMEKLILPTLITETVQDTEKKDKK